MFEVQHLVPIVRFITYFSYPRLVFLQKVIPVDFHFYPCITLQW